MAPTLGAYRRGQEPPISVYAVFSGSVELAACHSSLAPLHRGNERAVRLAVADPLRSLVLVSSWSCVERSVWLAGAGVISRSVVTDLDRQTASRSSYKGAPKRPLIKRLGEEEGERIC